MKSSTLLENRQSFSSCTLHYREEARTRSAPYALSMRCQMLTCRMPRVAARCRCLNSTTMSSLRVRLSCGASLPSATHPQLCFREERASFGTRTGSFRLADYVSSRIFKGLQVLMWGYSGTSCGHPLSWRGTTTCLLRRTNKYANCAPTRSTMLRAVLTRAYRARSMLTTTRRCSSKRFEKPRMRCG